MATVQIDETLRTVVERYCRSHGVAMNHFIQEALQDRLEELEDIEDLKLVRHEPTRPMSEVLKDTSNWMTFSGLGRPSESQGTLVAKTNLRRNSPTRRDVVEKRLWHGRTSK